VLEPITKPLLWLLRRVSFVAFTIAQKTAYAVYKIEKRTNAQRHPQTNRSLFESDF